MTGGVPDALHVMLRREEFGPDTPKWGPRRGVPIAVVNLDVKDQVERERDAAYQAASSAIPGVPLTDNPLDIRTPDDLKTIRKAVTGRYNISDGLRQQVVETMADIMTGAEDPGHRISAAKVIIAADKIDAMRDKPQQEQGAGVTVNILTPDAAKQMSTEELERRLKALESAEGETVE